MDENGRKVDKSGRKVDKIVDKVDIWFFMNVAHPNLNFSEARKVNYRKTSDMSETKYVAPISKQECQYEVPPPFILACTVAIGTSHRSLARQ